MSSTHELTKLSVFEVRKMLQKREISSVELVKAYFDRIGDDELNAFITLVDQSECIKRAEESDRKYKEGNFGELEGIPMGIKDIFCTKGIKTTAGSKMLSNFVPPYESTVTKNLLREGRIFLGKTNTDEFAMGSTNKTSYYGDVINPWSKGYGKDIVPGGSSGGSAAAVQVACVLQPQEQTLVARLDNLAATAAWSASNQPMAGVLGLE